MTSLPGSCRTEASARGSPPRAGRVLITGASGYVGRHLTAFLCRHGFAVHALTREPSRIPPAAGKVRAFPYQLAGEPDPEAFLGIDVVIHAASSTRSRNPLSEDAEVDAARKLLEAAERLGAGRFLFLSSQNTEEGARSKYARVKWTVETLVLARGGIVVRAGLIYGGADRGSVFGALDRLAQWSPCIPAFVPPSLVQPIHIDDLCAALLSVIRSGERRPAPYLVADPEAISITRLLRTLAWRRHRRYPMAVPVPFLVAGLAELLCRVTPGVPESWSERLKGLQSKVLMDTAPDCKALGVAPRPFAEGLTGPGRGRRRDLLEEGRVLLRYVTGRSAYRPPLVRYVRLIEQWKEGRCLDLPPLLLRFPSMLRLIDPRLCVLHLPESRRRELEWRLEAAAILAETHPATAGAFHLRREILLPSAVFRIAIHLTVEAALRAVALVASTLRRRPKPMAAPDAD